ncbi:ABC transporter permease [Hydrogenophaga sp. SL48]|uniref:ABC transporter permease n=1 Tax=Hydrogenophaga sp. SL48 TaxID=2806347 RepID=UPI001F23E989|nr:ABC transporter permease [Hydrogenophaga sp. SL48]UJW78847.1 ABC transporter permease [Hydrogenophaga sp. SL48]
MSAPLPTEPSAPPTPAALAQGPDGVWTLHGHWTLQGLGPLLNAQALPVADTPPLTLDGSALQDIDSAGAWVLQRWLPAGSAAPALRAWPPRAAALMQQVQAGADQTLTQEPRHGLLEHTGRRAVAAAQQAQSFLHFIGETAIAAARVMRHPAKWRLRAIWHEVQIGGFDALPIIGLTSFLLGIVVAYQGADQLRHYGANVFVVELVGYAMLREFAPLISAIIIAGRSGSAYAAQIGTMVVAEEVDALRTIGIDPLQRLVLPKIIALSIALPLLTVFADITGVFGGMVMARSQLDIGFGEFVDRFGRVMQGTAFLIGVGKSLVFALIIATVGCFQGLRTSGSADSVGRQTTLSVVQSIFTIIVADALFSVAFNLMGL